MDDLAHARALLADAARVAVLTGAGISTASGIGDFRGPQGRWTLDPDAERVSTLSWYLSDPDVRAKAWALYLGLILQTMSDDMPELAGIGEHALAQVLAEQA